MKPESADSLYESATGAHKTDVDSPEDKAKKDRAKANFDAFRRAFDGGHDDWLKDADKFDKFYQGDQWDPKTVAKLEAEGRPYLTLNVILAVVNVMLGEQVNNRVDIQYRDLGGAGSGAVLTKLAMAIAESNQYKYTESEMFGDGIIMDRGYMDIRMDYNCNVDGEVVIKSIDPREIILPPTAKSRDPRDWPEIIRSYWVSLSDIERDYGTEAKEAVRSRATSGDHYGTNSIVVRDKRFGNMEDLTLGNLSGAAGDDDILGCRVIDRQYKELVKVWSIVDPVNKRYRDLPIGTTKGEAFLMAVQFGALHPIQRTITRIRWTVSVDEIELFDAWSPYKTFTIIPYFPYFRRGTPLGMVRHLISPQEQFNKLSSQELHIVNSTANSGWIVHQGTLTNMTVDELAEKGSQSGIVLEVARGAQPPEKIRGNPIPPGIERIGLKAQALINELSGVSSAMMGMESEEVSGVALETKERRGQIMLQLPFDNLGFTRMLMAKKLLELIRDFYTTERIVTITEGRGAARQSTQVVINQPQPDGSIANDVTVGEYDVVISIMPDHETFDDIQFAQILNLKKVGVVIPDHVIIQHSKLDNREEIAAMVQQITGLAPKSEEELAMAQQMHELQMKTALAQLDVLTAEAEELRSRVQLNGAKAQSASAEDQRQLAKLEQDIQKKREELENIMQRHLITNLTKAKIAQIPKPKAQ